MSPIHACVIFIVTEAPVMVAPAGIPEIDKVDVTPVATPSGTAMLIEPVDADVLVATAVALAVSELLPPAQNVTLDGVTETGNGDKLTV
jgi:hypothetical protein